MADYPCWQPCFDLETWRVRPSQIVSPLELLRANGRQNFPDGLPSLFAKEIGAATSVLKHAAQSGFWDLPMTAVRRLAKKDLGLDLAGDDFTECYAAVKAILGCDDALAIQCMEHRAEQFSRNIGEVDAMLLEGEATDAIDEHDRQETEAHKSHIHATRGRLEDLNKALVEKVREVHGEPAAKKKKRPRLVLPASDDMYTQAAMQPFLPSNCRLHKDYYNNRWQLWYRSSGRHGPGPRRSKSRSWPAEGHRAAVLFLLRCAWDNAKFYGEQCHVQGLYD